MTRFVLCFREEKKEKEKAKSSIDSHAFSTLTFPLSSPFSFSFVLLFLNIFESQDDDLAAGESRVTSASERTNNSGGKRALARARERVVAFFSFA